jgi:pimeloyl-ACP methyl ester carboxylesterase
MQHGMNRREMLGIMGGALGVASLAAPEAFIERFALRGAPHETDAATWRAERRFVDSKLGRIAYVERGAGDVALFLHGFPLNGFQWRGAFDRLSPHRRCIAPDFLALGYTEPAIGQSVGPSAQVDMLEALLGVLGVRGRVDLIANDSGGAVAQLLLARHPDRVRSVLLTNCDTEFDSPPPALLPVIEMARAGTYPEQWLVPWLHDKSLARGPHGLGGLTFTRPASLADETIDTYLAPLVATPRRKALVNAYAIALERNPLAGIGPVLARCTAPTRIIWGTGDDIFSKDSPRYLDHAFGNSRGVRLVEGAKLFFPEEYPDLIAEEARTLWSIS